MTVVHFTIEHNDVLRQPHRVPRSFLCRLREADHPLIKHRRIDSVAGEPDDVGIGVSGEDRADRDECVPQRVGAVHDRGDKRAPARLLPAMNGG